MKKTLVIMLVALIGVGAQQAKAQIDAEQAQMSIFDYMER